MISVLGKFRSCRAPNLGCSGAESPGWFDVFPQTAGDVMHEWEHCCDGAADHQLPITVAFWITWIVSAEECSSLTQNLMQIYCSTHSVIVNVTATQYICSLNGVYRPHWLVQWSCHCSCMCIPVHSPWLPGYINVAQTILVILTMAGLFSWTDYYCVSVHTHTHVCTHVFTCTYILHACINEYIYIHLFLKNIVGGK